MRKLSREQRREIARNAAKARWKRASKAEKSEAMRQRVMARWAKRRRV
jgi:hypothetical protein